MKEQPAHDAAVALKKMQHGRPSPTSEDCQDAEHLFDEAAGADALLAQASALCPDLVLLDWQLPGLHATEVLPSLRALCPRLSVIVLSSRPEDRQPALATGADAFVSKGDAPEQLLKAVSDCSDKQRMCGKKKNNQQGGE